MKKRGKEISVEAQNSTTVKKNPNALIVKKKSFAKFSK